MSASKLSKPFSPLTPNLTPKLSNRLINKPHVKPSSTKPKTPTPNPTTPKRLINKPHIKPSSTKPSTNQSKGPSAQSLLLGASSPAPVRLRLLPGPRLLFSSFSCAWGLTWRFMGSHKWGYESPDMGYNNSHLTYDPTRNYP